MAMTRVNIKTTNRTPFFLILVSVSVGVLLLSLLFLVLGAEAEGTVNGM